MRWSDKVLQQKEMYFRYRYASIMLSVPTHPIDIDLKRIRSKSEANDSGYYGKGSAESGDIKKLRLSVLKH
jgi:hypothetical protein